MKLSTMRILQWLFFLYLWPSNIFSQDIVVEGEIIGVPQATLYIFEYQASDWQAIDSTKIIEDTFSFSLRIPKRGWYKLGWSTGSGIDIILGEPRLKVKIDAVQKPPQVSYGESPENNHLLEYVTFIKTLQQEVREINVPADSNLTSKPQDPQQLQKRLEKTFAHIDNRTQAFYKDMSVRKEATLVRKIARFNMMDETGDLRNYFTSQDFQDAELASSMFYISKLQTHIRKLGYKDISSVMSELNRLLAMTASGSNSREALLISGIKLIQSGPPENVTLLARRYQMEFPNSQLANDLIKLMPPVGPQIGDMAPDITLNDSTGHQLTLSSLQGNYVLLDFWASWCRPCRMEAPVVRAAFDEFKRHGFTIYSVSLDSNKEKWLKAVDNDGMVWYHVSDLQGWKSSGAAKYSVRSIPATFLIDPKGRIIAKNLRGPNLRKTLAQFLTDSLEE